MRVDFGNKEILIWPSSAKKFLFGSAQNFLTDL